MNNQKNSVQLGQHGESAAANELKARKFKIIGQNVRTPRYEIDIIAKKKRVLYFAEVKYRSNDSQGKGFEYVTPKKLQQMTYAAQSWCSENNYSGEYRLLVISVDKDTIQVIDDIWQ